MRQPGLAFLNSVREAARSLVRARLRTLLGLAGLTVGIASVIAMISAGEVATAESRKQFQALGTDIVTIKSVRGRGDAAIPLDAALGLAAALPSVSEAAPRIEIRGGFRYAGKQAGHGSVQGVTAAFAAVNRLRTVEGRFVSDMDRGRFFAVVGAGVAGAMRRLGAGEVLGEFVQVGDRLFRVLGVLADAPETYALPFQVDANDSVFVPIGTARRAKPGAGVELIVARTGPGVHHTDAVRDVEAYFNRRARGLRLEIVSAEQLIRRMESQVGLMTLLLGAIGSISLLMGGIGIMNIMLISVAERRGEIGLRRALGASQGIIQRQFLIEALILAVGGGLAGVVVGTGAAYGLCLYFEWEFFLSPVSILTGLGVSTAVGLFFGFQPANQAARLDPIVALQG